MYKCVLFIVFNHNYEQNIAKLRAIYQDRFSRIYFLVPFYRGSTKNVIPVYGSSYCFQTFIANGLVWVHPTNFSHCIFIADDLVLNPAINEENYFEYFGLGEQVSFIPEFFTLNDISRKRILRIDPVIDDNGSPTEFGYWAHTTRALNYLPGKDGLEASHFIPGYKEAQRLLRRHGVEMIPLRHQDITGHMPKVFQEEARYTMDFPLVGGYSDICIVSSGSVDEFRHLCGYFSSTDLFVELAIPTALLLSAERVVTEAQLPHSGYAHWDDVEGSGTWYFDFLRNCNMSIKRLLEIFPADLLYIHPIKLSSWEFK